MRRFAPLLITFSALMPAVVPVLPSGAAGIADARPESAAAPLRTECATPGALSLRRFEDGSAQLLCAGRVLVRVSVPLGTVPSHLVHQLGTFKVSPSLQAATGDQMKRMTVAVLATAIALAFGAAPAGAGDKDCSDFNSWRQAQNFYKKHGGPKKDPHRLDADHDGIACEDLR